MPGSAQTDILLSAAYQDGVQLNASTTQSTTAPLSRSTMKYIGGTDAVVYGNNDYAYIAIYDHVFTEAERAKAYSDFLNSYPIDSVKTPDYTALKPMDLSREKENNLTNITPDPEFNVPTSWLLNAGASIANGKLTCDTSVGNVTAYINPTPVTAIGQTVIIDYFVEQACTRLDIGVNGAYLTNTSQNIGANRREVLITVANQPIGIRAVSSGGVCILTRYSVHVKTGLVAAYNMIPNGNTLVDISGNGYNLTTKKLISSKYGLSFPGGAIGTVGASTSNFYNPGSSPFSISCRLQSDTNLSNYNICKKQTAYTNGFTISLGLFSSYVYQFTVYLNGIGFITAGYYVYPYRMNTITININIVVGGTTDVDFYLNGIFVERVSKTGVTAISNAEAFSIGDYAHGGWAAFKGEMQDFRMHNRILSLQEVKNYHNQFAKRITLREDFAAEGADGVAKVPSGWSKTSGSFKIGETVIDPYDLMIAGRGDFETHPGTWGTYGTNISIVTTSEYYTGSHSKQFTYVDNSTLGILYLSSAHDCRTNLKIGSRYKVILTLKTRGGGVSLRIYDGSVSVSTAYDTLDLWQTITLEFTAQSINGCYVRFNHSVESTMFLDNVIIKEIPPLQTFKNGTKYLECVTAGVLSIPSKQAYGTWEFDLYKGADLNTTVVYLLGGKQTNYWTLFMFSTEGIYLQRTGSTAALNTVAGYIALNTWYRIKITRSLSGIFTVYIKGGAFGNTTWTLVSTAGGTGTNPVTDNTYTTSEYLGIDIDAGDRIANIVMKEGIEQ